MFMNNKVLIKSHLSIEVHLKYKYDAILYYLTEFEHV